MGTTGLGPTVRKVVGNIHMMKRREGPVIGSQSRMDRIRPRRRWKGFGFPEHTIPRSSCGDGNSWTEEDLFMLNLLIRSPRLAVPTLVTGNTTRIFGRGCQSLWVKAAVPLSMQS